MFPRDGASSPLRARAIVDLPLPDSPTSANISPSPMTKREVPHDRPRLVESEEAAPESAAAIAEVDRLHFDQIAARSLPRRRSRCLRTASAGFRRDRSPSPAGDLMRGRDRLELLLQRGAFGRGVLAARCERTAGRQRLAPQHAAQRARAGGCVLQCWAPKLSEPGYRDAAGIDKRAAAAEFDQPPGVHHADSIGDLRRARRDRASHRASQCRSAPADP